MVRAEKVVEKPFDDVNSELKRRLRAYEEKIREIKIYSDEEVRDMLKEHELLLRHTLTEQWEKWERMQG